MHQILAPSELEINNDENFVVDTAREIAQHLQEINSPITSWEDTIISMKQFLWLELFEWRMYYPDDGVQRATTESILGDTTVYPSGKVIFLSAFIAKYSEYWLDYTVPGFKARGARNTDPMSATKFINDCHRVLIQLIDAEPALWNNFPETIYPRGVSPIASNDSKFLSKKSL
jgi:hypothetical protein